MMVLFSLAVVKRLKSDWIRSVLAFVHMIMSLDMLKKDPKSKALMLPAHIIPVNTFSFSKFTIRKRKKQKEKCYKGKKFEWSHKRFP